MNTWLVIFCEFIKTKHSFPTTWFLPGELFCREGGTFSKSFSASLEDGLFHKKKCLWFCLEVVFHLIYVGGVTKTLFTWWPYLLPIYVINMWWWSWIWCLDIFFFKSDALPYHLPLTLLLSEIDWYMFYSLPLEICMNTNNVSVMMSYD